MLPSLLSLSLPEEDDRSLYSNDSYDDNSYSNYDDNDDNYNDDGRWID